ncbi:MAG: signal peptidase I [Actinomycetota bacterium]
MTVRIEAERTEMCARPYPFPVSVPVGYEPDYHASPARVAAMPVPVVAPEPNGSAAGTRSSLRRAMGGLFTTAVVVCCVVLSFPLIGLAFGYRTYVITSASMDPYVEAGDAILLDQVKAEEVRVGDVIAFHPLRGRSVTTHRVIDMRTVEGKLHFRTQGDANAAPDPNLVPASNVVGRVGPKVPWVGRGLVFASTRLGQLALVVLPALLLVMREVWWLWRGSPKADGRSRPRRQPQSGRALATALVMLFVVLGMSAPATARFTDSNGVGANALTAGNVNPPTNVDATAALLLICQITLTWTPPATGVAPDGYDIYRSASGGPYTFRKHVGNVTTTTDNKPNLNASTTYSYRLRSTRSSWMSVDSTADSATTPFLLCL